ncbi:MULTISPECIES: alpha/beta hydrolase [Rhodomicrobium]|uniref:alpha/beta fold hydrolase n=1 Tax=Rhodomicrobium TaxID=1068 RepID=UPI000B4BA04A|nr:MULTISPECIES: alpha/beta hydrolase [Rhodomicrobium]
MRRILLSLFLLAALPIQAGMAAELWQTLPPTPAPVAGAKTGYAKVNGIDLFYAETGAGSPVVILHGGLGNSDYLSKQAEALAPKHRVILVDSRGHGRSTRDSKPYGYDLMTDDVVALLDTLKIDKADIVGWSDGGIIALDMAMRHPTRVGRIFAFGANTNIGGLKEGIENDPVFGAYIKRAGQEYARLSPTPTQYDDFVEQISRMWVSQPNWTDAQLKTIKSPVVIADGEHDEAIRQDHNQYMAKTIPGAKLVIMPNVSHFAFLQDPETFNGHLRDFLGDR